MLIPFRLPKIDAGRVGKRDHTSTVAARTIPRTVEQGDLKNGATAVSSQPLPRLLQTDQGPLTSNLNPFFPLPPGW